MVVMACREEKRQRVQFAKRLQKENGVPYHATICGLFQVPPRRLNLSYKCLVEHTMQPFMWSHCRFNITHLESIKKLPIEVDDVRGACCALFTRITLRQRRATPSERCANNWRKTHVIKCFCAHTTGPCGPCSPCPPLSPCLIAHVKSIRFK